jgi:hypothetical protein
MKAKYGLQQKLLLVLNELSVRGQWSELLAALASLNPLLTRFYIGAYWKVRMKKIYIDPN